MSDFTRRNFLKSAGILGAWSVCSPLFAKESAAGETIRLCHMTDIHICTENNACERFGKILRDINALTPKPDLIITGGDNVMNIYGESEEKTREQLGLIKSVFAENNSIPVHFCLGNHDVRGWDMDGTDPLKGKGWAVKDYGMAGSYYSFDRGAWRFVVMDTMLPSKDGKYCVGMLGKEQIAWLEGLLENTPDAMNVCVVGHYPLLSITNMEFYGPEHAKTIMENFCADGPEVMRLFSKHGNVRLALSGHTHRNDRIDYMGTTYICDGAVCGGWWKGDHNGCRNGYGLIDLHADGSFEYKYTLAEQG